MKTILSVLARQLDMDAELAAYAIPWGAPVPSFGDPTVSVVATLGLNPSNREFVDDFGRELDGPQRRFHTLRSLGLRRWSEVQDIHLDRIAHSCRDYFITNPYDRWFKPLDTLIALTGASYYSGSRRACHLDLVPYATASKWSALSNIDRASLLRTADNSLAHLIAASSIRILVLNGRSVVHHFHKHFNVPLKEQAMREWSLRRNSCKSVTGFSYVGKTRVLLDVPLNHELLVIGFNHNIQSSFGVTTEVLYSIRGWIGRKAKEIYA